MCPGVTMDFSQTEIEFQCINHIYIYVVGGFRIYIVQII